MAKEKPNKGWLVMDLESIRKAENDKRRADKMDLISKEQFLEDISFDMCWKLVRRHPELILESEQG